MAKDLHDEINERIRARSLHKGSDEGTYFNQKYYEFAVINYQDPLMLFKLKVYGYYAKKYKWTDEQAKWFIDNNAKDAVSHSDGAREYLYDWGRGHNKVTDHAMHVPHLDHIDPKSVSNNNNPENFRIRCARLNENKGNMIEDGERRATIIDMFLDMSESERKSLLEYLQNID